MKPPALKRAFGVFVASAIFLQAGGLGSAASDIRYWAVPLIGHMGVNGSKPLNNHGLYAFTTYSTAPVKGAVLDSSGTLRVIGIPWNLDNTLTWSQGFNTFYANATGINDSGAVVGYCWSNVPNSKTVGFLTSAGETRTLASPSTGMFDLTYVSEVYASAINNSGTIVGWVSGSISGTQRGIPLVWTKEGALSALPLPPNPFPWANAVAISESGVVVGNMRRDSPSATKALIWMNGTVGEIGNLGGIKSQASGVSDQWIVGSAEDSNGRERAFVAPIGGTMVNLGLFAGQSPSEFSYARAVNASGEVVGSSGGVAFLWEASEGMMRLDTLDDQPNLHLSSAISINDEGVIVAAGNSGLWMLTPVGESGAWRVRGASSAADGIRLLWESSSTSEVAFWRASTTGVFLGSQLRREKPKNWKPVRLTTRADGVSYAFWKGEYTDYYNPDQRGKIAFWKLANDGAYLAGREFAVGTLWSQVAYAVDPATGGFWIVHYRSQDGAYVLWRCDDAGNILSSTWHTVPGWTVKDLQVDASGTGWVLWEKPATAEVAFWKVSSAGGVTNSRVLTSSVDWEAVQIPLNSVSGTEAPVVIWRRRADATLVAWQLDAAGNYLESKWLGHVPSWTFTHAQTRHGTGGVNLFYSNWRGEHYTLTLNASLDVQSSESGSTGIVGTE